MEEQDCGDAARHPEQEYRLAVSASWPVVPGGTSRGRLHSRCQSIQVWIARLSRAGLRAWMLQVCQTGNHVAGGSLATPLQLLLASITFLRPCIHLKRFLG